jgi:Cdc6-like AAA superfamily ATPase
LLGEDTLSQTAKRCIADLRVTDPRDDKKRIQDTKGGLVQDSYIWVLENPDFCQWRDNKNQQLLWVKGDPGKGKTMLLCGIIDHLEKSSADVWIPSYFFCQATDERINTATSVVRGLIFMLLGQDQSLVSHIKKKYDISGKALFEDTNAWHALSEIFAGILQDTKLEGVCLMIDALDECVQGLPQLLDLIIQTSRFPHTKWLVSSRNWIEIEEKLCDVAHRLSLELNAKSISAAVQSYIEFKVSELTQLKGYQESTAKEVRRYLSSNANDTFL